MKVGEPPKAAARCRYRCPAGSRSPKGGVSVTRGFELKDSTGARSCWSSSEFPCPFVRHTRTRHSRQQPVVNPRARVIGIETSGSRLVHVDGMYPIHSPSEKSSVRASILYGSWRPTLQLCACCGLLWTKRRWKKRRLCASV